MSCFLATTRLGLYLVQCWRLYCIWPCVTLPGLVSCLESLVGALIPHLSLAMLMEASMFTRTLSLKTVCSKGKETPVG